MAELAVVSGVGAEKHLPRFDAATYRSYEAHRVWADSLWEFEELPRFTAAWNLLKEFLSVSQALSLSYRKVLMLKGSSGGEYFLDDNARNLYQIDRPGRTVQSICFHEADEGIFPLDDIILTKLLWIQSDEEKFRWHSNIQEMRYGRGWYLQFIREIAWMRLIDIIMAAILNSQAKSIDDIKTDLSSLTRFKQEYDNMVDVYSNYPRLLWRLVDRLKDHLDEEDRYILDHLPPNLAALEAYYAS